mmetsp:Transcript_14768/g.57929  ORF Transcript_14768/g.57929 Transcript_14768/m.57929 type:complete len:304 (-) Transcript_14768:43-954(-)
MAEKGGSGEAPKPTVPAKVPEEPVNWSEVIKKAGARALGGGIPGAAAMGIQVGSLMWLRTTMNYQYRHGTSTTQAMRHLYKEGGIARFYKGVGPALIQGPMSRFGDTAANAGMLSFLDASENTRNLPTSVKTAMASGAAALWRINLMPVDTCKTIMQVEGVKGIPILRKKIKANGVRALYHGAIGASLATYVGHFPWFYTHNKLEEVIPKAGGTWSNLGRNALIGFCSSLVSDTTSNSIRVIKTTRQTSEVPLSYAQCVKTVVAKDGVMGLFGRGLKTRLLSNGIQGMLFNILWKGIEKQMAK